MTKGNPPSNASLDFAVNETVSFVLPSAEKWLRLERATKRSFKNCDKGPDSKPMFVKNHLLSSVGFGSN